MDDETCLGIDFTKDAIIGQCNFNYQKNEIYSKSSYYDAWQKDPKCVKATATTSSPGLLRNQLIIL